MNGPSIEAVNLSKSYGSFKAVSDLTLKLEGARCVGFLGPNGAGKTTTMKILTGLISPTRGRALVNGVEVGVDKKKALASCASLIETPEIYPALTPKEALMMISEMRGVRKEDRAKRIEDALAKVKMEGWEDKKVGSFSKGMKQRVVIASILVSDPDVIILDEPTTGLDPRGMSEVREIVKSLGNRLVFMSSHLLAEVTDVCQEVAMIDHGKLIVYDTIANVTERFSEGGETVEVGFVRDVDDETTRKITQLEGVLAARKSNGRHVSVKFAGGLPAQERLLEQIAAMKFGVVSFKEASAGLEDAYLKLIKETL